MLYFLISLSFAECPTTPPPSSSIVEIQSADLTTLKEQSHGCTTLLELWASWCKPCLDLKKPLHDLMINFPQVYRVPISADYTKGALKKYLKRNNQSKVGHYRLAFWSVDGLKSDYAKIGARFEGAIPFLVLLSAEGNILYSVTEPKQLSSLEEVLTKHLHQAPQ